MSPICDRDPAVSGLVEFCLSLEGSASSVATLQVYCDESGKLQDQKCVVFAGCIFRNDEMLGFDRKWREFLASAGVRYVTMKEAMHLRGEFQGWSGKRLAERDDILETLALLLMDRSVLHQVATMDTANFQSLSQSQKARLKDPTYAGFEVLLRSIVDDCGRKAQNRDHRFHIVYDLSQEYSETCLRLFHRMRTMEQAPNQYFPSIAFADDREFPGLQAADMIAYCKFQEFTQRRSDRKWKIIQRLSEILKGAGGERGFGTYQPGRSLGGLAIDRS